MRRSQFTAQEPVYCAGVSLLRRSQLAAQEQAYTVQDLRSSQFVAL